MKKPVVILVSAFLLFSICICISAIQIILYGCFWWECAPERNFRILELELPSSLFPDGAITSPIHPMSDDFGPIEDGAKTIYWENGNGIAVYDVFRYSGTKMAIDGFEFRKGTLVNSETKDIWKPPADLTFSSRTADAMHVACGYWSQKRCAMVARYQEYVIFFDAVMDAKMTFSRFEKILVFIDKQISSRLYP